MAKALVTIFHNYQCKLDDDQTHSVQDQCRSTDAESTYIVASASSMHQSLLDTAATTLTACSRAEQSSGN